jgi:hypothetical protein
VPIGSTRSLHSIQNQINSNFNQNLLTLSTNVMTSAGSTSSPTPTVVTNSSNFLNSNKVANIQQRSLVTTPSTSSSQTINVTSASSISQTVASKYTSIFSDPNDNHFDFVNNGVSYMEKDLNSNDSISLQMQLGQSNHSHHSSSKQH